MTKKYRVTLTPEERTTLLSLIQKGKAAARTLTQARILLKVDEAAGGPAYTDPAVCEALHVGLATVARVRQAFVEAGLDVALHRRRELRPRARKLDGAQEAHLIALVCGAPPRDGRGGRCGCWRTNWCAWSWWTRFRTRRSVRP